MPRAVSLLLAAALAAGSIATTGPAAAMSPVPNAQPQAGIQLVGGSEWSDRRWQNDDWRWRHRYHSRYRGDPGFSFHFGLPFPQIYIETPRSRDCYRAWDGRLYCRTY